MLFSLVLKMISCTEDSLILIGLFEIADFNVNVLILLLGFNSPERVFPLLRVIESEVLE